MEVLFLRHGQTEVNTQTKVHRKGDEAVLDQVGIEQVNALVDVCASKGVQKVYYSPERRAEQTAGIISHGLGVESAEVGQFAERDWGDWAGWSWADIQAQLEGMTLDERYSFVPPNGESWQQMDERLKKAIEVVVGGSSVDTIAVVTHGGALRALMPILKGQPKESSFQYDFSNASVTIFDYKDGEWHVQVENDVSHLDTGN